jgi:hypothetical protein
MFFSSSPEPLLPLKKESGMIFVPFVGDLLLLLHVAPVRHGLLHMNLDGLVDLCLGIPLLQEAA